MAETEPKPTWPYSSPNTVPNKNPLLSCLLTIVKWVGKILIPLICIPCHFCSLSFLIKWDECPPAGDELNKLKSLGIDHHKRSWEQLPELMKALSGGGRWRPFLRPCQASERASCQGLLLASMETCKISRRCRWSCTRSYIEPGRLLFTSPFCPKTNAKPLAKTWKLRNYY